MTLEGQLQGHCSSVNRVLDDSFVGYITSPLPKINPYEITPTPGSFSVSHQLLSTQRPGEGGGGVQTNYNSEEPC